MGVIHRDIKPSNLMLDDNGVVKIMDFGIARMRGTQRLTRVGLVGTYAYLAPEQFAGGEGDERSDLSSLACVIYEMLTGTVPLDASSETEMMRCHLERPPEPLGARLPQAIDPQLDAAMLRALAKNPLDRFATVGAFSDAIGATAMAPQSIGVVRDGILSLLPPPSRRDCLSRRGPATAGRFRHSRTDKAVKWLPVRRSR